MFGRDVRFLYQDLGVQRTGELLVECGIFDSAEQTSSVLFCIYNSATSSFVAGLFVTRKVDKVVNFLPFVKDGSFKTKAIAQGFAVIWFHCKELRVGCNFLHGQNISGRSLI